MNRAPFIHIVIAFALCILAAAAYAVWYLRVEDARERAAVLVSDVQKKEADVERIQAAGAALSELTEDERTLGRYFVDASDVVSFLEYLEGAGAGFGAEVEVVSVSSEGGKPRGRLSLSARITGSFDAVVRTLGWIEYGPYDVIVGNVTFDSAENGWNVATALSVGMKATATPPPRTP